MIDARAVDLRAEPDQSYKLISEEERVITSVESVPKRGDAGRYLRFRYTLPDRAGETGSSRNGRVDAGSEGSPGSVCSSW
jgi:hypothetical protein